MVSRYEQLVPVIFGSGAIGTLSEEIAKLGKKKALLVYDGGVKAAGIGEKAEASLKAAGMDYVVFDKITSDPPTDTIDEGALFGRAQGIDIVVGVGGGSCLDAAKAIAVFQTAELPSAQHIVLPPKFMASEIPVILVPTTAGTGSEATVMSVLTDPSRNLKSAIFTRSTLAIVDPDLTLTVPPSVTAYTGLDALSHAIESVTSKNWNPRSEAVGLWAIEKIGKYLKAAYLDGGNLEAREMLAAASNLAGIAFTDTNVHYGHCIADGLSLVFHTPHGYNCALATPEVLKISARYVPDKVRLIGEALGIVFDAGDGAEEYGEKTAERIYALMHEVELVSLSASGKTLEETLAAVEPAFASGMKYDAPFEATREMTVDIYTKIYNNYR
ncbi:MAG: iron-containing alcohol dehydrogenase [Clostridiales Family XIII bacterium]|jgi:alcohol dehydrogenase class IV|nr:iron-containing alcohol dehydrogenase [Clostridiales Family XIII bacterium]